MRVRLTVLVLSAFVLSVGLWAADDPLTGTWEVNLAKSKHSPGYPVPKSTILTWKVSGNEVRQTAETVNADGTTTSSHFTANLDGKDYPVTGAPDRDMAALKRIGGSRIESISKKAGKKWRTSRLVVSKDGKTLTITQKGTREGKPFSNVIIYDKQ